MLSKSSTVLFLLSTVLPTETCHGQQIPDMFHISDKLGFTHKKSDIQKGPGVSSRNYTNEEKDTFDKFASYYDSTTTDKESENLSLTGKTNWKMPEWANGMLISSGPSEHETDGYQYNHFFDGLGRFSSFKFEDGEVKFTSKMLRSKMYKTCKAKHRAASGLLFSETTPKRATSMIPGANVIGMNDHGDNNWISMERLADKKTFVGTTDDSVKLEIDINTLDA